MMVSVDAIKDISLIIAQNMSLLEVIDVFFRIGRMGGKEGLEGRRPLEGFEVAANDVSR